MERRSVETVAQTLNAAGVRFLVAGDVAVVAHGLVRFTADLDLILDPDPAALRRAVAALSALGYRPRAPVAFEELADTESRRRWAAEKGLTVFSTFSSAHKDTGVDLFLECPLDFESAYARALRSELPAGPVLTFMSLPDLLEVKRAAGRPRDLEDIAGLRSLHAESGAPVADDEHVWEVGWEGHELAQRRRLARLTLAEKLDWLEEAHRLVRRLREADTAAAPPERGDAR